MPHPTSGPPSESSPRPGSESAARPLQADGAGGVDRPLPPLPDGGLAAAMPDWLRADPERAGPPGVPAPTPPAAPEPAAAPAAGLAPIDPTTFVTEADLPAWIRRLVADDAPAAAAPAAPPIAVRPIATGSDSNPGPPGFQPPPRAMMEPVRRGPPALAPDRPPIRPEVPAGGGIRPVAARPPQELPAATAATVPPQRPTPSPTRRDGRSSTVAWALAAALLLLAVLSILVGTGAIP